MLSTTSLFPCSCASFSRAWVAKEDCSLGIYTAATAFVGTAGLSGCAASGFDDAIAFAELVGSVGLVECVEVIGLVGLVEAMVFFGLVTASAVDLLPVSASGAVFATAGAGSVAILIAAGLVDLLFIGSDVVTFVSDRTASSFFPEYNGEVAEGVTAGA